MDVRLVHFDIPAVHQTLAGPCAPTVRLAHKEAQGDNCLRGERGCAQHEAPALLVSYFYLSPFLEHQAEYRYRDWVLDSGAFSAHNSGKAIDLQMFIDKALELLATDPTLTEVFALDVIGDPDASYKNTQEMWRQGVPAIPCFHCGEPEDLLAQMAKDYPKLALGGMVSGDAGILDQGSKLRWLSQCFARIWPKRVHGFGVAGERVVLGLPFHSVDATNWEIAPCAFGNWKKFGSMSVRGSKQDLRSQVHWYMELEAKARVRWAPQMAELEALPDKWPPARTLQAPRPAARAALVEPGAAGGKRAAAALGAAPAGRLALNGPRMDAGTTEKAIPAGEAPAPKPAPAEPKKPAEIDDKWKGNWWKK